MIKEKRTGTNFVQAHNTSPNPQGNPTKDNTYFKDNLKKQLGYSQKTKCSRHTTMFSSMNR